MTEIGSIAAKTHLPQLLERVSRGEKIVITKRGKPVAMLVPPEKEEKMEVREVLRRMRKLRRGNKLGKDLTIRDLIEQGRRY
jgi:prevent-host-death family protein